MATLREFQSTHPVRDATIVGKLETMEYLEFQSTHPVRDATVNRQFASGDITISIHASRAGCDAGALRGLTSTGDFNPRIPCGMRPGQLHDAGRYERISIHASRAGCDRGAGKEKAMVLYFNPRIPCGMRP